MTFKAIVEKIDESKYRAVLAHPFAIESEGSTEAEAVRRLQEMATARLRNSKVVDIPFPDADADNPWRRLAGLFKDHPDWDEYLSNIEEHRREMDALEQR